jgi:hypothetical protein
MIRTQAVITSLLLIILMVPYNNCSKAEVAEDGAGTLASNGMEATITTVSEFGVISGWAFDPADMDRKLMIALFLNGPSSGGGIFLGSSVAALMGLGGTTGGHNFSFQLPMEYRDGELHKIYAYVNTTNPDGLIPNSPRSFRAYSMSDGFQSFFDSKMEPRLNGGLSNGNDTCNTCHNQIFVDSFFYALITPSPFDGGSATNNILYNKLSGGVGHNGGNFCNGNDGLCADLEAWWNQQFP